MNYVFKNPGLGKLIENVMMIISFEKLALYGYKDLVEVMCLGVHFRILYFSSVKWNLWAKGDHF